MVVDGPLALRMRRLDAAREGATGRQVLTLPLLAARLAGGFIGPATQEILYPVIRQALDAGGYEDIDKVSQLPGMPVAVLSALRDWWDMEVSASLPDNARLRDFVLLERRVRGTLPSGMLSPPDLTKTALERLHFAPKLVGAVTIQDVPDIKAVWRPLIQALCDVVPVRWIGSQHSGRDWFAGEIETRPSGAASLLSADLCADPRSEVREALRWARALVTAGKASPDEIAISAASPAAWDDAFLVLSREAGLPVHFTHGIPALATREGQACAALADILLRGLSQERVRLLFARLPRSPAKESLPSDWAKGLRRSAALTSPGLWRHALEQARGERVNGDLAERALLPVLDDLARGIASADVVGRRLFERILTHLVAGCFAYGAPTSHRALLAGSARCRRTRTRKRHRVGTCPSRRGGPTRTCSPHRARCQRVAETLERKPTVTATPAGTPPTPVCGSGRK